MSRFDPNRRDLSPYGFSCVRWTPTSMPRGDRHNEIEINLLDSGELVYLLGGKRVTVPARRLFAFWAITPHQILEFQGLTDYYVLTIPLTWFLEWQLPESLVKEILDGKTAVESNDDRYEFDKKLFENWIHDPIATSRDHLQIALLEIEARLRRFALNIKRDGKKRKSAIDKTKLNLAEEMASFVAQNYAQPISSRMIGEHVGLHPNYAMTLFQQTFGTTLTSYITQHRLSHAQRLLVTTDQLILDIAYTAGFGSLSRFNEAFRHAFGSTPREYRKRHSLKGEIS